MPKPMPGTYSDLGKCVKFAFNVVRSRSQDNYNDRKKKKNPAKKKQRKKKTIITLVVKNTENYVLRIT